MLADNHQCPECNRALPREQWHKAAKDRDGWFETLLVCVACGLGWYCLWEHLEGCDRLEFTLNYKERTEPGEFRRFVHEIEQANGLEIDLCSYAAA